jgi:hypothetical protein
MEPQTEKSSEQVMKFFTLELLLRFNSSDDDEADRANDDWEAAVLAYRTHPDGLRDQMPEQVMQLAGLNLHDAEMLAIRFVREGVAPATWRALGTVARGEVVAETY